jgi:LysR family tcuABC transcriptional regulator
MYSLSINLEEAAALPLILPTPAHGLRRRISIKLEQRNLSANVIADIPDAV